MLKEAYNKGLADVAKTFSVKEAGPFFDRLKTEAVNLGKDTLHGFFGKPHVALQQFQQGKLFSPEGMLHHSNVLWPKMPDKLPAIPEGGVPHSFGAQAKNVFQRGMTWASRAQTLAGPALGVYSAIRGGGDPNEGRLSNALGAITGGLASAYASPVVGMLGAPYVGRAGTALGKQVGRFFGSAPRNPYQDYYNQIQPQQIPPQQSQQEPIQKIPRKRPMSPDQSLAEGLNQRQFSQDPYMRYRNA